MNQADVKQAVEKANTSVVIAYWSAPPQVKEQLASITPALHNVLTALNEDDLESRTADFQTAAATMQHYVLPGLKKLDASVAKLVQVDDTVKTAISDLMKLSNSVSFFKIPAI